MVKSTILESLFPKENVPVFVGKKMRYVQGIIFGLAINGPSTTFELSRTVLEHDLTYEYKDVRSSDVRKYATSFGRLIVGRERKKTGKKKLSSLYPGLIENGYVIQVGSKVNEKGLDVPLYFLTLKGCLLALSFNFNDQELKQFLNNAARNHLFFAYANLIQQKISLQLVKEIFVKPVQNIIENDRLHLQEDLTFYFPNFAQACGNAILKRLMKIANKYNSDDSLPVGTFTFADPKKRDNEIEELMKNNFYYAKPSPDWKHAILERYYKKDEDINFFYKYSEDQKEISLLYQVMQQIHFSYYAPLGIIAPRSPIKKLPPSRGWKQNLRYKQKTRQNKRMVERI